MTPLMVSRHILFAFDDHSDGIEHYLNLKTGEIEEVIDENISGVVDEELTQDMEEHPEKYRRIDPIPAHRAYNVMVEFVESLAESKAKWKLSDALDRRGPFRNFKNTLHYYPEIREEWFRFQEEAYTAIAMKWFHGEGIDAELRPPVHKKA